MDVVGSRVRMVLAGVVLAGLAAGFLCEVSVFRRAFFSKRAKTVEKRISRVRTKCAEKFPLCGAFVTLNGGFVRVAGQHHVRGVMRTADGMLVASSVNRIDARRMAARTRRFARLCSGAGAKFVYIQLPKKMDVDGKLLPPGVSDIGYSNADRLVDALSGSDEVRVLDWRRRFAGSQTDVLHNFYRTDHHWNTDASFAAAGMLVDEIAAVCGESPEVRRRAVEALSAKNWAREIRPRLFLGSQGRQTGPLFSGLDDVIVLKPKFPTEQCFSVPSSGLSWKGSFAETVMRQEKEIGSRSLFADDVYSILYSGLGKRYPLVVHENKLAPVRRTVVVIGDSFSRPVEGFLSVAVSRLYAIDPRRVGAGTTVVELVKRVRPDVVVHLQSAISFNDRRDENGRQVGGLAMFDYGLDEAGRENP